MKNLWIHVVGVIIHSLLSPEITAVLSTDVYTPGQDLTVTFIVKNSSAEGELVLPPGWKRLSRLKMPTQEGHSFFYTLRTEVQHPAGTDTLRFRLQDGSAYAAVPITIKEHTRLHVHLLDPPSVARSHDTLTYTYILQNAGNSPELVYYTSCTGGGDSLVLPPGESRRITLREQVSQDRAEHLHTLEYLNRGKYQKVSHSVPVFLSRPPKEEHPHAWPLEIGLRYIGALPGTKSYQFLAEGRGYLGKEKVDYLEVLLRGPDRRLLPMFGLQDHYSLYYSNREKLKVHLGDYHLLHSPLMEPGRYGRGMRLEYNAQKWMYSAFYQQARLFFDQRNSFGTAAARSFGKSTLYVRTFSKQYRIAPDWSHLGSVAYKWTGEKITSEQEFSAGTYLQKWGAGMYSRINFQATKWGIHHQGIRTSRDFHGFFYNSTLSSFQVSHQFSKKWGMGIQHFYSKIQSRPDITNFQTNPQSHNVSAWLSTNFRANHRIFVSYLAGERKDTLAGYHYVESYGSLNYYLQHKRILLQSQLRQGYTRTRRDENGLNQGYTSANFQPGIRWGERWWTSLYGEYQSTARFTGRRQELIFYGGDVQYALDQRFGLQLSYRNNYAPDELYQQRSLLQLNLRSEWGPHKVNVLGGSNFYPLPDGSVQRIMHFSLTYTYKLGLRRLKKVPSGRVLGSVTGAGGGGVALYIAQKRYMTDADGKFDFGKLKEGTHQLKLAPAKVGVLFPATIEVQVEKGKIHTLEIPLVQGASLGGRITYPGAERPVVLAKLYSATGSHLTDVRPDGSFSFKMLHPGEYRLHVYLLDEDQPYTWKEANQLTFTLGEGEEKNLGFNLLPITRIIQFQSSPVHLKR